jgi:hypothetical protein
MTVDLTLFDALVDVDHDAALSVQDRYERFRDLNPQVMRAIERVCDEWVAAGGTRLGMKAVFEQLRWRSGIATRGDGWLLNNSFTSRYTRDLIARRPDLGPLFHVRELRAA